MKAYTYIYTIKIHVVPMAAHFLGPVQGLWPFRPPSTNQKLCSVV